MTNHTLTYQMLTAFSLTLILCSFPHSVNAQSGYFERLFAPGVVPEPDGSEDFGSEDLAVSIPEPMVFDLVRPLGAHKGETEINVLGLFPFDGQPIDWAPEIEIAIADGFAVEFELPFEDHELEAYKLAIQYTFGTACDDHFIHGTQMIFEPDVHFDFWEITALYLAGIEFNETFSSLMMLGFVTEIEEGHGAEQTLGIFNISLFADLSDHLTAGIESDLLFGDSDDNLWELIPQLHWELTDHVEVQMGAGVGIAEGHHYGLAASRVILSW